MRCSFAFTNNIYIISRIWRISLLWILLMPIPIRYSLKESPDLQYTPLSLSSFLSLRIENHYEYYTYPNPLPFLIQHGRDSLFVHFQIPLSFIDFFCSLLNREHWISLISN